MACLDLPWWLSIGTKAVADVSFIRLPPHPVWAGKFANDLANP